MEQKLKQQKKLLKEAFNSIEKLETLLQEKNELRGPAEFITSEPEMIDEKFSVI